MVRRIVGFLVQLGLHERPDVTAEQLRERPPKAPAEGLWLEEVETWLFWGSKRKQGFCSFFFQVFLRLF